MSGYCTYPGCENKRQGCFRLDCMFQGQIEYTADDAIQDFELICEAAKGKNKPLDFIREEINRLKK